MKTLIALLLTITTASAMAGNPLTPPAQDPEAVLILAATVADMKTPAYADAGKAALHALGETKGTLRLNKTRYTSAVAAVKHLEDSNDTLKSFKAYALCGLARGYSGTITKTACATTPTLDAEAINVVKRRLAFNPIMRHRDARELADLSAPYFKATK